MTKYDVFISYHRKSGVPYARMLQQALAHKGYRCFLDVDSVRDGSFKNTILKGLRAAHDFLFLLTPGALDGISKPDNNIRLELEEAVRLGRKVILVALRGCRGEFSHAKLPDSLAGLAALQVTLLDPDVFFDQSVEMIEERFTKRNGRGRKIHGMTLVAILSAASVLAIGGLFFNRLRTPGGAHTTVPSRNHGTTHPTVGDKTAAQSYAGNVVPRRSVEVGNGLALEMVWCPPGTFVMGSPTNEIGRQADEALHVVTLTKGFWIGTHPVTQRIWNGIMGSNPSFFTGEDLPVERVTWYDANKFAWKVSATTQKHFSLPTEAQWEYACRAGANTAYFWGTNDLNGDKANCDGNHPCGGAFVKRGVCLNRTTAVGRYPANAWGLFDMAGNVYEWCIDWYGEYSTGITLDPTGPTNGVARVLRGGNWNNGARYCRSAARVHNTPDFRSSRCGFRLVMTE